MWADHWLNWSLDDQICIRNMAEMVYRVDKWRGKVGVDHDYVLRTYPYYLLVIIV